MAFWGIAGRKQQQHNSETPPSLAILNPGSADAKGYKGPLQTLNPRVRNRYIFTYKGPPPAFPAQEAPPMPAPSVPAFHDNMCPAAA